MSPRLTPTNFKMIYHGPATGGYKVFAIEGTRGSTRGKTNMKKNFKIRKLQFYILQKLSCSQALYILGSALVGFQCVSRLLRCAFPKDFKTCSVEH